MNKIKYNLLENSFFKGFISCDYNYVALPLDFQLSLKLELMHSAVHALHY